MSMLRVLSEDMDVLGEYDLLNSKWTAVKNGFVNFYDIYVPITKQGASMYLTMYDSPPFKFESLSFVRVGDTVRFAPGNLCFATTGWTPHDDVPRGFFQPLAYEETPVQTGCQSLVLFCNDHV